MLGLGLSLNKNPIATASGGSPAIGFGDTASLSIAATDSRYQAIFYGDTASLSIAATDSRYLLRAFGDTAILSITAVDGAVGGMSGDTASLEISTVDARYKVAIAGDTASLSLAAVDAKPRIGIVSDTASLTLAATDSRTKVSCTGDTATLAIAATDSEWEEDFVTVYDPVTVTVNASATTSSAFSIAGKIPWITAPVTTSTRTVKLQHTPDAGTTWNDTGVSWATSTSVQTEVNSETLAKVSGATGPGLANFRLSYDSSLAGNTSHIVRSRT